MEKKRIGFGISVCRNSRLYYWYQIWSCIQTSLIKWLMIYSFQSFLALVTDTFTYSHFHLGCDDTVMSVTGMCVWMCRIHISTICSETTMTHTGDDLIHCSSHCDVTKHDLKTQTLRFILRCTVYSSCEWLPTAFTGVEGCCQWLQLYVFKCKSL